MYLRRRKMEKSAIQWLCYQLGQEEHSFTDEHKNYLDSVGKLYEKFSATLTGEELSDFKKLCESYDGVNAEESEMFFRLGFKFAVKLMAESLT